MAELTGTLIAHRKRLGEIAGVLAGNGLAAWVKRGSGLLDARALQKVHDQAVGLEVADLSEGQRLRHALSELGTTWVKFGQMLSLHPDVVGPTWRRSSSSCERPCPPTRPARRNERSRTSSGRASPTSIGRSRRNPSRRDRSRRCIGRRSPTAPRLHLVSALAGPKVEWWWTQLLLGVAELVLGGWAPRSYQRSLLTLVTLVGCGPSSTA